MAHLNLKFKCCYIIYLDTVIVKLPIFQKLKLTSLFSSFCLAGFSGNGSGWFLRELGLWWVVSEGGRGVLVRKWSRLVPERFESGAGVWERVLGLERALWGVGVGFSRNPYPSQLQPLQPIPAPIVLSIGH